VARGTQHRKRRPAQNARGRALAAPTAAAPRKQKQKTPQWQEQLFFQRLRTHAKWAYVGLAAAFVLGFVLLGVGSGSTGLSDLFQNAFNFGSGSSTSISSLQHKVQKDPSNATTWQDLATAYEAKQQTENAIAALVEYTALRPKDVSGLADLAQQYTLQAQNAATSYTDAETSAENADPFSAFQSASTAWGKLYSEPKALQDPIGSVVAAQANAQAQTAYSNYTTAQTNAEQAYKKIAKLTPSDVSVQFELGQAAYAASDYKTAVSAFARFLKLSPNDVDAPQVRQLLKEARAALAATKSGSG
jgi:tetratricopeptide (TPR) repeat protein